MFHPSLPDSLGGSENASLDWKPNGSRLKKSNLGVTPPFVKKCTLRGKVRKRLAPKWTQLAISESSVTSPMIVSS
jgi:hypothetical protein